MARWMKHGLVVVLTAAAGSQAGHLLAYAVRFGAGAGATQSHGVHAYFPLTAQLLGGAAGLAGMLALLAIGAARLVGGTHPRRRRALMDYMPLIFLLQLAFFAGQETLEAVVAGSPAPDAVGLLLWGTFGQLPAALLGTLAIAWLQPRAEAAVETLRRPAAPPLRPRPLRRCSDRPLISQLLGLPDQHAGTVQAKRGPPALLPA